MFKFYKYITPTSYFNLNVHNVPYHVDYNKIDSVDQELVEYDNDYKSKYASLYDASYQLLKKGYITHDHNQVLNTAEFNFEPVDEYRFLRKYFSKVYSYFVLLIRLAKFCNPIKEFIAFFSNVNIARVDIYSSTFQHNHIEHPQIDKNPLVSVIIPTLNRYSYLKDILNDFTQQTYRNFEIIILDQSDKFNAAFYKQFHLDMRVHHLTKKGVWNARNFGIKQAKGNYLAFSEDDVRIKNDWLEQHLKCLNIFNAEISSGVFYPVGEELPKERLFYKWSDQLPTGNVMMEKEVFAKVGLFDLQFEKGRMGDGEFGLRCYINGLKNISNPFASCIDLKADEGGFRELGSWDAYRVKNIWSPRPVPSVLYFYRSYFGDKLAKFELLKNIPKAIIPYKYKHRKKYLLMGIFLSLFLLPLISFQVLQSWRLSGIKLREGAKVEFLK